MSGLALRSQVVRRAQAFAAHCGVETALCAVTAATGVSPEKIRAGGISIAVRYDAGAREIAHARQEVIYLSAIRFGMSLRKIGECFGVSHIAIRNAISAVEERREDPLYDRHLDELELELMGAA